MGKHLDEITDDEWSKVFGPPGHPERNPRGFRFRNQLAAMFTSTPPWSIPGEGDYRNYFFHLRDLWGKRWMVKTETPGRLEEIDGLELLVRAMERATAVGAARPSPGSLRAHAMAMVADAPLASRSLPARPYQPPTPEQWAELTEIKARMMARFDIDNLDSKNTERKGAT